MKNKVHLIEKYKFNSKSEVMEKIIKQFLNEVSAKNKNEPEFMQAVTEFLFIVYSLYNHNYT